MAALRTKKITVQSLYAMNSAERKAALMKHSGVDEEVGSLINARFERAMLSKQKNSMVKWIQSTISAKDPIRRDMLKKVGKMEEVLNSGQQGDFLSDLAEMKLGMGVTKEEAETILKLKNTVDEMKARVPSNSPMRSEERLAHGLAIRYFKKYTGNLKLNADELTLAERVDIKNIGTNIIDAAGATKSVVATLDNSFIGRQGIKALMRGDYKIWWDAAMLSFKSIGKELTAKSPKLFGERDDAVMDMIMADIYSRPNAMNGKYAASKNGYGLGQFHEEAFPTSIPSRIPFLGKLFKASETAFTGSALRMRADLADAMIAQAERNGIDMLDEKEASAIGSLVTSLTGRGELSALAPISKGLNATFFAPRFLKANFNTLTAHTFDKTMTPYARRQAAKSTLRIAASIGTVLAVSEMLNPGSVEWDPRSSNFGKITIGNKRFDITGGMSGIAVLAARLGLIPGTQFHNGEFGMWKKSSATGAYSQTIGENFGQSDGVDLLVNFFQGKLSPLAGAVRDILRGEKYSGEKPDLTNTTLGLVTPISAQILQEELAKGNDRILFNMIAEGLGFSSTDLTMRESGKRWSTLKEEISSQEFNDALRLVTKNFNARAKELKASPQWKQMTNEEQTEALNDIKTEENDDVLSSYGL